MADNEIYYTVLHDPSGDFQEGVAQFTAQEVNYMLRYGFLAEGTVLQSKDGVLQVVRGEKYHYLAGDGLVITASHAHLIRRRVLSNSDGG